MKTSQLALGAAFIAVALGLTWLLFFGLPEWYGNAPRQAAQPLARAPSEPAAAPADVRKIKARLFYVAADGLHLTSVARDVPFGADSVGQAREILNAQLAPAADPFVSAVPTGTALRAVFITPQGEAFVDLSRDATAAHPGGSVAETLTIYTIVHALTFNLPAVKTVQILVDGKEVETLAGHIDTRRPLPQNAQLTVAN
jgi:hypothetical protein